MNETDYDKLAERQTKALGKSMKQTEMRPHIIIEAPRWWEPIELSFALLGAIMLGYFLRGLI